LSGRVSTGGLPPDGAPRGGSKGPSQGPFPNGAPSESARRPLAVVATRPESEATPRARSLQGVIRPETERGGRGVILKALEETGGNVTQAAQRLKISRKSLQNKMKEFGLRDRE